MDYTVRTMTRQDLDTAVSWAAKEGWNPGLHDADPFYQTDPNGFFMGYLDNQPIASLSAVSYGNNFGFMGFYITAPEHRNQGYGIQVWSKAMEYLKDHNVGLDGVVAQQENYKKSGFTLACRNIRYEGKGSTDKQTYEGIVEASGALYDQIQAYDDHIFPVPRPQFLQNWMKQPESLTVASVNNGTLQGYGMIRRCQTGYKVGPLFADNADTAEKLFLRLQQFAGDAPVFFDTPEVNPAAVRLAEKYAMKPMFETARMYTKKAPNVPLSKVFGVTTFELG